MKHKKLVVGITITILASGIIGGILMTQMKTPFDIFLIKDYTKPTKDEQIDYLKKHEQEMIDFVKTQNPKVESVKFDWDSIQTGVTGNGTLQGAGDYLLLFGYVNNDKDKDFRMDLDVDDTGLPEITSMTLGQVIQNLGE